MEDILAELNKCLSCKTKPCVKGCPLNNDIPEIINLMKEDKFREAYNLLLETNIMPSVCGRICPFEKQCQGVCTRGKIDEPVKIGDIEKYLGDYALEEKYKIRKKNKEKIEKIAIIGSGPAGLSCGSYLARKGYSVDIYEKKEQLGGLLTYGIPNFRLEEKVVNKIINEIINLGIEVKTGFEFGKNLSLEYLEENYDAIFISIGANRSLMMSVEGKDLEGVYGGNDLLEEKKDIDFESKRVIVIGGGDVAVDVARTINRKKAKKVSIYYRRARENMPAEEKQIKEAIKEGIEIRYLTNIVKIIDNNNDGKVDQVECMNTNLIEENGKIVVKNVEGSNYKMDADIIIMAIGAKPDIKIVNNLNLELDEKYFIKVDENNKTSREKIFAGGLITNSKNTVAYSIRSGRNAGESIEKFLNQK